MNKENFKKYSISKVPCRRSKVKSSSRFARGVATLPTVLALGILILAIGIGIMATSLTESFISAGSKNSAQALRYAEAGAHDALIKIARKKNYSCATTDCYTIDFVPNGCTTNDACARVAISTNAGTSGDPKIITSKGQAKSSVRILQVSVVLDTSANGEISSATWQELTN